MNSSYSIAERFFVTCVVLVAGVTLYSWLLPLFQAFARNALTLPK
jgi:hypothetical protein